MQYRTLGKTGEKVSILGLGTMRLPSNTEGLDTEKATQILDYSIENGINLIDTGHLYHQGENEKFLGEYLETINRKNLLLSNKLPTTLINTGKDMNQYLNLQLETTQQEYFDIYHLQGITDSKWKKLEELNVIEFIDQAKSENKIKYASLSYHGSKEQYFKIMDAYDWDTILLQLSYVDINYQAGQLGVEYAHNQNIGTMIMEPLRGGALVKPPEDVQKLWNTSTIERTPVEWALLYLWNMKAVNTVLSGMDSIEQVKQNINIANQAKIDSFTYEEEVLLLNIATQYQKKMPIPCTLCKHCLPCPENVNIPLCLEQYSIAHMLDTIDPETKMINGSPKMAYDNFIDKGQHASQCNNCGDCRMLCPELIDIPTELMKVKKEFGH